LRILLDTHILIWALMDTGRLSAEAKAELSSRSNDVLFSAVSIWEIAIKSALGRTDFQVTPREITAAATAIGFVELPLRAEVAARVAELPLIHRDPFDRLLVAQAIDQAARLFTVDTHLRPYSDLVQVV
jgi:PIN domain nuclease of toxin-antitoxin system